MTRIVILPCHQHALAEKEAAGLGYGLIICKLQAKHMLT
jgi:hypothetical protein